MKKIILIHALWLISSLGVSQYRGGMEAGGNITTADFDLEGPVDTSASWGIRLGYVGEYGFTENLYARFALLVNQRGFQFADERWGLNVVDVPLNLGYKIALNEDGMNLFIDGGFNVEYNFRAFTRIDGELVTLSIGSEEDDIKTIGLGLNFGTGVELSPKIKLRFNYYNGLTNLLQTEGDSWKNQVYGLAINYFLRTNR